MEESVQKLGKFLSREKTSKSSTLDVRKANVYKFYPVLSKAVTASRGEGLKGDLSLEKHVSSWNRRHCLEP